MALRIFPGRRAALTDERGSLLVEVMVGAAVLAIAAAAILGGLDGAQSTGATNKARSVQASLAQQDIERMRSMPVSALTNLNSSRPVRVGKVQYTVLSQAEWVRDSTGVVTCSSGEGRADYLKLTSTVTSSRTTVPPVVQTGLLTPPVGQLGQGLGAATIRVTDRDGDPVVGVTVTLSGPASLSERTNSLGCAVFGYITAGSYTSTVPSRVGPESVLPASEPFEVYGGKASFGEIQAETPVTLRANFVPPPGNSTIGSTAMVWESITVKNALLPDAKKTFVRATTPLRNTFVEAPNLFPFADGLGVYAGTCAANEPSPILSTTTFDSGGTSRSVSVVMPTLRVTVNRTNTSTNFAYAEVKLTPLDSGCSAAWTGSQTFSSSRTPRSFDVAVPFGNYEVCASTRTSASNTSSARRRTANVDLRTPVPPTPDRALPLTTPSSGSGSCLS